MCYEEIVVEGRCELLSVDLKLGFDNQKLNQKTGFKRCLLYCPQNRSCTIVHSFHISTGFANLVLWFPSMVGTMLLYYHV